MTAPVFKSFQQLSWFLPRFSVLDRYIASELLPPFLFGIGAFSSLGVSIGSLFDLVRKVTDADISLAIAFKVFALQIPYFLTFSFPMGMLLAALLTYSRFSSDSELIALRSCGISIYRLVLPTLVFSLIVTAITFTFNELVVPAAKHEATISLERALKEDKAAFQETNIIYPEFENIKQPNGEKARQLVRLFYADRFDGDRMWGLTILDRSQPEFNQIILSEFANWNPQENTWEFFNGSIYLVDPNGAYRNIMKFERHRLQLPRTPLDLAARKRDYAEMNLAQALEHLEALQLSGDDKKIRKLQIRIHNKLAIPFACVSFGLVGAALGTKPQRTSKATGFGISVLVILTYYLLMSISDALGLSGVLAPWMAGWLPTLSGLAIGVWLLMRVSR